MNRGPEYTLAICMKQECRTNVVILDPQKYKDYTKLFKKCHVGDHYWSKRVLMLISGIVPFMLIVPKHKVAQFGLKGQCVLVPADLKKIETSLPRPCDLDCVISLALKSRLSDKTYH